MSIKHKVCSYYMGRKVVFRKWILVMSLVSGLLIKILSIIHVKGEFILVVLMYLGR